MLSLALALALAQANELAPPTPPLESPPPAAEPDVEAPPEGVPPVELLPPGDGAEGTLPSDYLKKPSGPSHTVTKRVLLSGAAGVAASFAGLGLSLALTGANPALDTNFAVAALSPILITGVGYAVHSALGGRGEPILAYLLALAVTAGAAGLAAAIDGTNPMTPVLTTLIGTLPATAGAIFVLELTTRKSKRAPQLALLPTGISAVF
ncbi:MAG: hypothetical protein AB1938_08735 [Myxococcota bacterium]